jgi:hypothetical protein
VNRHVEEDAMEGRVLLALGLAAIIVVSTGAVIGTVKAPQVDSKVAGNPCVSDADCMGNHICCPITGTCTTVRGCRKDPL